MSPDRQAVELLYRLITREPLPAVRRCVLRHYQCSNSHSELVTTYREERQRQEMLRDEETAGYDTELAEYPPLINFRNWLESSRR